jgi:sulfide dehydrogenase cytochrome subunit
MRILVLLILGIVGAAQAQTATGVVDQCAACHGPDGVSRWGDIPNISGLPEVVIANAMYDFRGSTRPCRSAACSEQGMCPALDMCQIAKPLSDAEMDVIAGHYSAQPFSISVTEFDPALAMRGAGVHAEHCEECHSRGGSDPVDEASILRGQNTEYLMNALADYRSGDRLGEQAMLERVRALSDEDVSALLNFYASPMN